MVNAGLANVKTMVSIIDVALGCNHMLMLKNTETFFLP